MKIEQRPWKPQDLLDDLQSIIDEEADRYLNTRKLTLCMARDYLKEYFSSLSNDPLTLKELREMDGELVWVVQPHETLPPFWGIVDADDELVTGSKYCADFEGYDTEWKAYRSKPE